jgi:hypothetical protein
MQFMFELKFCQQIVQSINFLATDTLGNQLNLHFHSTIEL